MYKVSILVPVYNVEQYIERCARSLFEQTYPDLEFVFVNDCTPDRSMEILEQVMKDYPNRESAVKIINHERNRGVAAARNTLLDNADGDFVSWVDSDDWLEPNSIELLADKQLKTNSDIVSGNIFVHYVSEVKELVEKEYKDKREMLYNQLKDTWTNDTFIWGRLFRRSLFEDNHIRCVEGRNFAEDRYIVVRLSYYANSFTTINAVIYNYDYCNNSSITHPKGDISSYLRNQYQHLWNWMGIRDFFADKEEEYYQLAVYNTSRLLQMNLEWMLKFKTPKDFDHIVELIEENEDCMRILGWQKKGIKGAFQHSFNCMWMKLLLKRVRRSVKIRLNKS